MRTLPCILGTVPSKIRKRYPAICTRCGVTFWRRSYQRTTRCSRQCSGADRIQSAAERLWAKVDQSGECWIWTGSCNNHGYGHLSVNGRETLAHRASWALVYGSIPHGMLVRHTCDNPPCVRPDHLQLGDRAANMRDMSERRRASIGTKNPRAKLTPDDVGRIRQLLATGEPQHVLAQRYGVHPSTISLIASRRNWAHF